VDDAPPSAPHLAGTGADTVSLTDASVPRPRLDQGACIGRYVILRWLGEGGMGVVYKAYDPELERPVALKLLHTVDDGTGAAGTERRERLFREAKALARLSHPNVLAIYDVGTFGADVFLATEFVEGPTLSAWLTEAKRSRAEVLAVMLDAGEGLAAAHKAGLVHRDFKPANVMVSTDGRVRVLDFGLARADPGEGSPASHRGLAPEDLAAQEALAPFTGPVTIPPPAPDEPTPASGRSPGSAASPSLLDRTITEFGQVVGTPAFMPPEQHTLHAVDARSDQYSFCVTLYQALYGELPFEGRGAVYNVNLMEGRVRSAPAGSGVPRWLRAILHRGLSVEPGARFGSMDELLAALRTDPDAARRRRLTGAGAAAALLLVIGGLAFRHAPPAAEPPCRGAERKLAGAWDDDRRRAVHAAFSATGVAGAEDAYARTAATLDDYARRWVSMHVDACEATQVRGEQSAELLDLRVECLGQDLDELRAQVDVLAKADATTVSRSAQAVRALPRLAACADVAALRAPIRPPSDEATRARVESVRTALARGRAQQHAGRYASALEIATSASDEAAAVGYRPLQAEALYLLADVQDDQGDYATSERTFRRSFAAALAGRHEAQALRTLSALVVEVGLRQGRFPEAHDWAALAEAESERLSDPFSQGELARNEGRLLVREGKLDEARRAIEKCLSIWEPALGQDDFAVAGALTDLGNVRLFQGDMEGASAEYTRSLAITERIFGPDSPSLAPNLNNLGEIGNARGDLEAAAGSLERARSLWQGALGPDHPKVALALYNLSITRRQQGDVDGAMTLAQQALAIWRKALSAENPDVALGMHGVAMALRARKDYAGALALDEASLAMDERLLDPGADQLVEALVSVGELHLEVGHPLAQAAAPLSRALRLREAAKASGIALGQVRFDLAKALVRSDPARSHELGVLARQSYASDSSPRAMRGVTAVDQWLASAPR
jgi:serine/threonine protein kinase/tetratricopeptide (TPR) repeat protein